MIKRIIYQGWANFLGQSTFNIASIFIMLVMIFLVTSFIFFQAAAGFLSSALLEKMDVSVYLNKELVEEEILKIREELVKIPEVKDIEYVSREEALIRFTQRHQNDSVIMESLAEVGGNPFLASLNIRAWNQEQYAGIFNFLDNSYFKDSIAKVDYLQRKPIIERFHSLVFNINKVGVILSFIFGLIAVFIVFNQIRLAIYNSRKEIKIMRLVGASNWLIRGPFLVQGIIIGILAVFFFFLVFVPACFFFSPKIEMMIPGFSAFGYFLDNFFLILAVQLLIGIGMVALSSVIALRRHLMV